MVEIMRAIVFHIYINIIGKPIIQIFDYDRLVLPRIGDFVQIKIEGRFYKLKVKQIIHLMDISREDEQLYKEYNWYAYHTPKVKIILS